MAKIKFLEPEEVQALLEVPNTRSLIGLRNRVMMQVMAECGLRISEVLNLRPRDISIKEQRIIVQCGKNGKMRTVYWRSNSLSDYLQKWKGLRPEGDFLFTNVRGASRGTKVSSRNLQKAISLYSQKAGIQKCTPHTLRHSFSTAMLRSGVTVRTLQKCLGHSSLQSTQIYLHVVNEDVKRAMRGF